MANQNPIFPIPLPQHYSDYGFDPQIDCFQVSSSPPIIPFQLLFRQSIDPFASHGKRSEGSSSLHFKLQKLISKEDRSKTKRRRQWWRSAFGRFWKKGRSVGRAPSGPVYSTESRAGRSGRSGPMSAGEFREVDVPYFRVGDLDLVERDGYGEGMMMKPIYLVT